MVRICNVQCEKSLSRKMRLGYDFGGFHYGNQFSEKPAAFVGRDDSARRCLADFANGAPGRCVPVAHVHRTTEPAGETVAPYRHKIDFPGI